MDKAANDPIWEEALKLIAQQVNEGTYRIWFEATVGLGLLDDTYTVGVPSDFAKDWIDARFQALIADVISQVVGDAVRCRIVVSRELSRSLSQEESQSLTAGAAAGSVVGSFAMDDPSPRPAGRRGGRATAPAAGLSLPRGLSAQAPAGTLSMSAVGLNDRYTFDSFVIGPSNRFAHAAALAAAESPGTAYNPLFIYGGVGLGKTHLLQAIGQYVLKNAPELKVRYVTIEMFTNDFINLLRDDSIEGFKTRYRTNDVLLIDDIQFLQNKEQTQEEFFHTFNTLYDSGKQIVISSDRHPKGLRTLEDRLVSRFESGLITDIQAPDLETRIAILRKKARTDNIRLADDDVLTLIASRVPTNIRELEGCLTRVVAFSSFSDRPINVELAREVLKDIPETASTRITIDLILSTVAEVTGVSVTEVTGDRRSRPVVEARHLAMYLARELTDASLPKIGERIGGRDHTTVLHAVEKMTKLMRENREMYGLVQRLTTKIKSAR